MAMVASVAAIVSAGAAFRAVDDHARTAEKAPVDHDDHDDHDEHDEHDHEGHGDEVKLTAEGMRRAGVRVEKAAKEPLADVLVVPARVAFDGEKMAHVSSPLTGRVRELKAGVGSVVKAGDVLAVIESAQLAEAQSDYLQRRSSAENLKAVVELAKTTYERAQKMYDASQSLSLTEVQLRQREYRSLENERLAARMGASAAGQKLYLLGMDETAVKSLEESGKLSPLMAIRTPIDGTVLDREVTLGELVTPEKEAIFLLADLSSVWILGQAPEDQVGVARPGTHAEWVSISGVRAKGIVTAVGSEVSPESRTVSVRVEALNPEGALRAGMAGEVAIQLSTEHVGGGGGVGGNGVEERIVVPAEAVVRHEGGFAVFVPVEGEANTFSAKPVKVGDARGGKIPILDGLSEGASVVVRGTFVLKAELGKASAQHEH
jgi:membrane fusion protein, heavy metal efflux system